MKMKKILKKISTLALAAALLMGVLPGQTAAASGKDTDLQMFKCKKTLWFSGSEPGYNELTPTHVLGQEDEWGVRNRVSFKYDDASETLIISGNGWTEDYYYKGCIPEDVDLETYHPMRTHWDDYADKAKKIIIEDGITAVGLCNFNEFTALECVEFADSVKWITAQTLPSHGRSEITLVGKPGSIVENYAYAFGYGFAASGEAALRGDMDGSGDFGADDALRILEMVAGKRDVYGYSGDTDGDGKLSANDALRILMIVAGKIER